jgi:hypothetical protein
LEAGGGWRDQAAVRRMEGEGRVGAKKRGRDEAVRGGGEGGGGNLKEGVCVVGSQGTKKGRGMGQEPEERGEGTRWDGTAAGHIAGATDTVPPDSMSIIRHRCLARRWGTDCRCSPAVFTTGRRLSVTCRGLSITSKGLSPQAGD